MVLTRSASNKLRNSSAADSSEDIGESSKEFAINVSSQSSSTTLIQELNTLLECSICCCRFKQPRSLPCQHTFCSECLTRVQEIFGFNCPICREEFEPGSDKSSLIFKKLIDLASKHDIAEDSLQTSQFATKSIGGKTCKKLKVESMALDSSDVTSGGSSSAGHQSGLNDLMKGFKIIDFPDFNFGFRFPFAQTGIQLFTNQKNRTINNFKRDRFGARIFKRCPSWPNCQNNSCIYTHPKSICRNFPFCRFGESCCFLHPEDKPEEP